MSNILVNDIFDELLDENKRLLNELLFSNKCINLFIEFKSFIDSISLKLKPILVSNELIKYNELCNKYEEINRKNTFNCEPTNSSTNGRIETKTKVNSTNYRVILNYKLIIVIQAFSADRTISPFKESK